MRNTGLPLTDIILQTQSEFRPQHDECKRGVVVHVIRVVHSVLLTWKKKMIISSRVAAKETISVDLPVDNLKFLDKMIRNRRN